MRGRVYTSAKDPNSLTHPSEPGSHTALMPEIPGTSMHSEKPFKSECCTRPNQEVTQKTPGPDCCAWLSRPHPQAADAHLPSPECATVSSTTPWGQPGLSRGRVTGVPPDLFTQPLMAGHLRLSGFLLLF